MILRILWYLSTWLYFYRVSQAAPVGNKISKALETQDKICSMKYSENEGSYKKMFETFSGLSLPTILREYNKKPYTGFKFLRAYNIQLWNLRITSKIDVIFCRKGKIKWKVEQPLADDINWTRPLCVYTPDAVIETTITGPKHRRTSKERALEDLNNFHCFKFARRKKYTNRKASFFFPRSWVGGMFYCDLEDEQKLRALHNMEGNLQFKKYEGQDLCDMQNSMPLMPMQSDDYSKNWIEFSNLVADKLLSRVFKPQITKYVPYINTPNDAFSRLNFVNDSNESVVTTGILNWGKPFREQALEVFHRNKIYTNNEGPWFSEIAVDEKYQISSEDISLWQTWMDHAITKLVNLTDKPSKSFVSSMATDIRNNATSNCYLKDLYKKLLGKVESKIWNRLQLRDKIISILGDDPERLQYLQTQWKNLQMNCEKFYYSYE